MYKEINVCGAVFAMILTNSSFAVDIPEIDMGAQKFDNTECVSEYSEDCINNQCMTSEALDCQEQCRSMAKAKCEQQAIE